MPSTINNRIHPIYSELPFLLTGKRKHPKQTGRDQHPEPGMTAWPFRMLMFMEFQDPRRQTNLSDCPGWDGGPA